MKRSVLKLLALLALLSCFALAQQPVNDAQTAGSATATAASGVKKVGIVGSTGTALDGTTAGVLDENLNTINNVTPLTGNGVSGTGSLRVNIASDNTAFSVKNEDGAGNALTSNSTTYLSKYALDGNLLGTLGTAFTTPGFVDIKGADGNVFVRSSTAANFLAKVDVVGNAGASLDAAAGATAATNSLLAGAVYNSSGVSPSTGSKSPCKSIPRATCL